MQFLVLGAFLIPLIHIILFLCNSCREPISLDICQFCIRTGFAKSSEVYKSLGPFNYVLLYCTADRIQQLIANDGDRKCVYIGEVGEGTGVPSGAGILVRDNGDIREGYWHNGKWASMIKGRYINHDGISSISKRKDSESNWQGIAYGAEISKINGKFDKEMKYGKGELNYNDGTKYQGEWMNMDKHRQGTLYSSNQEILKPSRWENDQFMDKEQLLRLYYSSINYLFNFDVLFHIGQT